jgi:hypothetical protein
MAKWLALFALPLVFRAVVTATADSANLTVTVASAVSGGGLPPAGYNLDPAFSDDFKWSLTRYYKVEPFRWWPSQSY